MAMDPKLKIQFHNWSKAKDPVPGLDYLKKKKDEIGSWMEEPFSLLNKNFS